MSGIGDDFDLPRDDTTGRGAGVVFCVGVGAAAPEGAPEREA
jgi:hypothetical protein